MKYYMHHDDYELTTPMVAFAKAALYSAPSEWWKNPENIPSIVNDYTYGLTIDESTVRCAEYFLKWIATVRNLTGPKSRCYGENWVPTEIDIMKSRLFWWIRSGHAPLPVPPPTAYSCPWYEVVVLDSIHSCLDARFFDGEEGDPFLHQQKAILSQCFYDIIEKKVILDPLTNEESVEYILGFENYRFRVWKDSDFTRKRLAMHNPHRTPEQIEKIMPSVCSWVVQRQIDLEQWPGEPQPFLAEI